MCTGQEFADNDKVPLERDTRQKFVDTQHTKTYTRVRSTAQVTDTYRRKITSVTIEEYNNTCIHRQWLRTTNSGNITCEMAAHKQKARLPHAE